MSNIALAIIATLSIILILVAILFISLLRKIRSSNKDNFNLIEFPKETDDKINNLIVDFEKKIYDLNNLFNQESKENKKIIADFDKKLEPFEKVAREKMDELKLFKTGYIDSRLKSLISGIIDTIEFIENGEKKIKSDTAINKYLDEELQSYFILTKDKLLIILEQFGVEKFEPALNTSNLDQPGCAAQANTEPTDDVKKINLIHSIVAPGYKIEFKKGEVTFVKKAIVKVYALKKDDWSSL